MSKRGLGKGLDALIPSGSASLEELPVGSIRPNPRQPRRAFEEEALSTLAASIRQLGVLQPLVVRRGPSESFEIVVGERRWRAAQQAGLATVPAVVVDTDDRGSLLRALSENLHRRDLNPIEEAAGFQQLVDEGGLTHEELAERVGFSRPAVTNALRLLSLPSGVQRMVIDGILSAGHARALVGLPEAVAERLGRRAVAEGLSVRVLEGIVRETSGLGLPSTPRTASSAPRSEEAVAETLSEVLGARVKVLLGKRKGRIVVEFGAQEDLRRLFEAMTAGRPDAQWPGDQGS